MCCESCPSYDDCSIKNKLKEDCCKACPDYDTCYPAEEEDKEEWDY